jgi:hypothetical protein
MIPNVVHFIYFNGPNSRDFSYLNYLAVRAAHDIQQPDTIYMHYNTEPVGNPNWDRMKSYVTLAQITPPERLMGVKLGYVQYQADVVRLQKLLEHGGIYLDTDILMLKPLTPFMDRHCVMGAEGYVDHAADQHTSDVDKVGSISNAVIMAEPQCPFIRSWLDATPKALLSKIWAYHAVMLPLELYKLDQGRFDLQKVESFVPFDFRNAYIFENDHSNLSRLTDSYTIHMWETIWRDKLSLLNDDYMASEQNLFTHLFGKYATP